MLLLSYCFLLLWLGNCVLLHLLLLMHKDRWKTTTELHSNNNNTKKQKHKSRYISCSIFNRSLEEADDMQTYLYQMLLFICNYIWRTTTKTKLHSNNNNNDNININPHMSYWKLSNLCTWSLLLLLVCNKMIHLRHYCGIALLQQQWNDTWNTSTNKNINLHTCSVQLYIIATTKLHIRNANRSTTSGQLDICSQMYPVQMSNEKSSSL